MSRKVGLLVLGIVLIAAGAQAGVKAGEGLLTINVGYAMGKSAITGDNIDGGVAGLDYQKLSPTGPWSAGFSIGYGGLTENVTGSNDSSTVDYSLTTVPIFLGGKYWLGDGEGKLQGYIGASFGMYFTTLDTNWQGTVGVQNQPVSGGFSSQTELGFGIGVPVGVAFTASDAFLITANYTLNWFWDNSFLDNEILNAFSLGVAFIR